MSKHCSWNNKLLARILVENLLSSGHFSIQRSKPIDVWYKFFGNAFHRWIHIRLRTFCCNLVRAWIKGSRKQYPESVGHKNLELDERWSVSYRRNHVTYCNVIWRDTEAESMKGNSLKHNKAEVQDFDTDFVKLMFARSTADAFLIPSFLQTVIS